jgi:predicted ABC-type exoprotein transport system permease subunit
MNLDELAQASAYGMSLVGILYYLNQAMKRVEYIPAKYMLALTMIESAVLVGLYFFATKAFVVLLAALGLAAAVTMFHAGVKEKTKGPDDQ